VAAVAGVIAARAVRAVDTIRAKSVPAGGRG
jgi:hypothetical protein